MNQNKQALNFKDNPYQYTRAVRFRAVPYQQGGCFKEAVADIGDKKPDLLALATSLKEAHTELQTIFYVKDDKGGRWLRKKLAVNKTWLKRWHQDMFYLLIKQGNNKRSKYTLADLTVLHTNIEECLETYDTLTQTLQQAAEAKQESQFRRSEIANAIQGLLNNRKLPYLVDFLREAHTKEACLYETIDALKKDLDKAQKTLRQAEACYLPAQSAGVEVARASLNYYTVNKKSKEYYGGEIEKTEAELSKCNYSTIQLEKDSPYEWKKKNNNKHKKTDPLFTFNSEQEKEWLKRWLKKNPECGYKSSNGDIQLSLDQTYAVMKAFKAEQKAIFYDVITHIVRRQGSSYEVKNENHLLKGYRFDHTRLDEPNIRQDFSLFDKELQNFIEFTKRIQQENAQPQKGAKQGSSSSAKERGKLLFVGKNCHFKAYCEFCEHYKAVAQLRGKLIAQIKGIEKERQEAVQTNYWGLISVDDNRQQLWLVPKEKMQKARVYNDGRQACQEDDTTYLCAFESLTMRALHKLCFAEQSSFVKDMPEDLKRQQKEAKEYKTKDDDKKIAEKNKKKLEFLKAVLQSAYAKDILQLGNFDLQTVYQAQDLKAFEQALEDACYYIKRVTFTEQEKQHFLETFNITVLDVSSYDLEGRNKTSENKYHTDLWQAFWNGIESEQEVMVRGFKLGKIRLNPEVKIRYREKDEDLKDYISKKFDSSFKHRRLEDQFTVNFTLALNAGKRHEELAFSKPEEILEKINDFNQKLNQQMDFSTAWKYGIDRGQKELATLCLAKFSPDDTYTCNDTKFLKPTFPDGEEDIKCYELKEDKYGYKEPYKDGKGQERQREAIKNLSYFINNEELFDIRNVTCLDLTTAKVIKGKIVTNGDVMTYLKLKKEVAKRKLHDLYYDGKIAVKKQIEWHDKDNKNSKGNDTLRIITITPKGTKKETIYQYFAKYQAILSKEDIKRDLNRYLNELREKDDSHTPSILKINHLRDAVTANMVGVICHLQKEYPGFVILEDLEKSTVDKHFGQSNENISRRGQSNENISRRLEIALYNKFQSLGLVPPHIKDILAIREEVRAKNLAHLDDEKAIEHYKKNKSNPEFKNKSEQECIETSKNILKSDFREKNNLSSQIGTIVFVDEFLTSQNCPYCEGRAVEKNKKKRKKDKKEQRFSCYGEPPCGFNTNHFKPEVNSPNEEKFALFKEINDPDKVAAYNVAKKIKNADEIRIMALTE